MVDPYVAGHAEGGRPTRASSATATSSSTGCWSGPRAWASTPWPPGTTPGCGRADGRLPAVPGGRPAQGPVLRAVHAGPGPAGPDDLPGGGADQGRGARRGPPARPAHGGQARQPGRLLHPVRRGAGRVPGATASPCTRAGWSTTGTGEDLGTVDAVELVTVGQRRGMGHGADGRRRFVTAVDVPGRRVMLGPPEAAVRRPRWRCTRCLGRTCDPTERWSTGGLEPSPSAVPTGARCPPGRASSRRLAGPLRAPQRPVAPGQTVALYDRRTARRGGRVGHRRLTRAAGDPATARGGPEPGGPRPGRPGRGAAWPHRYHNERYYRLDAPEIADAEYDALVRELRSIEADHPDLAVPESPTCTVGGAAVGPFAEVAHRAPMMSLDNAFTPRSSRPGPTGWPGSSRRDTALRAASSRSTASPSPSSTGRAASCRPPPGATA